MKTKTVPKSLNETIKPSGRWGVILAGGDGTRHRRTLLVLTETHKAFYGEEVTGILLGIPPETPEVDYGWIEPRSPSEVPVVQVREGAAG